MGQQTGVQVWRIFDVLAFALGPLACPLCEKYLNSVMLQLCNCFQNVLNIIFTRAEGTESRNAVCFFFLGFFGVELLIGSW